MGGTCVPACLAGSEGSGFAVERGFQHVNEGMVRLLEYCVGDFCKAVRVKANYPSTV